jgi:hypothetical protein
MWVKILKIYAGPLGLYVIDQKLDVPKEIVDKLPKGTCKPVPAPWDEKIDHKAIAAAEQKKNATLAIEKAVALRRKVDELTLLMVDFSRAFKNAQDADKKAQDMENKAAKKSDVKKIIQFADAKLQIAGSKFAEVQAEKTIAILEAEDAEQVAAKLAEEAGIGFEPAKGISDADGQTVSSPAEKSIQD